MMNQVILVGRLTSDLVINEVNGKKRASVTLAVPRNYKNSNGEYDTDFINCVLWGALATNTMEYCKKGDIVGLRGKIETQKVEDKFVTEVIAEKVTFLSSKKESEE